MRKKTLTKEQQHYYRENWEKQPFKYWCDYFDLSRTVLERITKEMGIKFSNRKQCVSDEARRKISEKRKAWLLANPEKHPWRNRDKFKSEPCLRVAEFLEKNGIKFIAEFQPQINGRFFSIDLALPDRMIALEINGNQHYERSGKLKPYYQERHDLLVAAGWNVLEIHYSACFNFSKWVDFVETLKSSEMVKEFDYFNYKGKIKIEKPKFFCDCGNQRRSNARQCGDCRKIVSSRPKIKRERRVVYNLCECGKQKITRSVKCLSCNNKQDKLWARRAQRPTKEELLSLVWEFPLTTLSKRFGVSDVAIKKWVKSYKIQSPPSGYWAKLEHGKIEECREIKEKMVSLSGIEPKT